MSIGCNDHAGGTVVVCCGHVTQHCKTLPGLWHTGTVALLIVYYMVGGLLLKAP